MTQTAAWVARTDVSSIDVGPDTEKLRLLSRTFLAELREGRDAQSTVKLNSAGMDVLHAAIEVVASASPEGLETAIGDARLINDFMLRATWPAADFGERQELLRECSLWGWRLARKGGKASLAHEWAEVLLSAHADISHDFASDRIASLTNRAASAEDARRVAGRVLSLSQSDQRKRAVELQLEDPEMLLALCGELRRRLEASPTVTYEESSFLYQFLSDPVRPIGLFDEREYFLGELALLAGTACRGLARREEARRWFDRSEANFRLTVNVVADWARVSYQRLALLLEERRFDELREQTPPLVECFEKLDMNEDALKCRFLDATSLVEAGEFLPARDQYRAILDTAQRLGNERLSAAAKVNLVQVHGSLGDRREALELSRDVLPLLRRLGLKEYLAKIQWGIGSLLRNSGQLGEAVDAFRSARSEFADLRMMADVAATQLLVADVLLEAGNETEAVGEIVAALPIVDEYRLVPEGMAALALLRESVRQHKVNHQALRDLHGFFEETVS